MNETQTALYLGVFIGMIVMVITRPLADWITRAIRMTRAQWAHVRQQGGDLSAGTRAIVQRDMEGGR